MMRDCAHHRDKQLASWLYLRWLTSPEIQAKWIADYSGYLPTQASAMPLLESYAAENTVWATGAELAPLGPAEPQTFRPGPSKTRDRQLCSATL